MVYVAADDVDKFDAADVDVGKVDVDKVDVADVDVDEGALATGWAKMLQVA